MAEDNPFTIGPPPAGTPHVTAPEVKPATPVLPAMPVAPAGAPLSFDSGTHKLPGGQRERTEIPAPPAVPRHAAPVAPPTEPTAVVSSESAPVLELADGRTIDAGAPVLIGRNPAATREWPNAQLVAVDDEAKSVSKTHAAFAMHDGSFAVTDLDSTNGVLVTMPDGTELVPEAGQPLVIDVGTIVDLGEYRVIVGD